MSFFYIIFRNLLLFSLIFLCSIEFSSVSSQELGFESHLNELENKRVQQRSGSEPSNSPKEMTGLEKDKGSLEPTPEFSYYYIYFGKPIIKYNDVKEFGNSFSVGTKRNAEIFLYGAEYSYTSINSKAKLNDISMQLGFQTIWRHRFQPFATISFGTAFLKDSSKNIDVAGYKTAFDVGINLNPYSFVKYFTGMRYNMYDFEKIQSGSIKSQEFYIMIGLSF